MKRSQREERKTFCSLEGDLFQGRPHQILHRLVLGGLPLAKTEIFVIFRKSRIGFGVAEL